MVIEEYKLFPTLVTKISDILTTKQCLDIFEYIKTKEMRPHSELQGSGRSTYGVGDGNILAEIANNVNGCENILDGITKAVSNYSARTNFYINSISNSWVNIQEKGCVLGEHTHPLSVISGALYINVDAYSSKLYFKNPNPFIDFTLRTSIGEFSAITNCVEPKIGELILFPSWLLHGSNKEPNQTENRAVISFNAVA